MKGCAVPGKAIVATHTIVNPILPPHWADPWMIFHGVFYYYSESRHNRQIWIRRSQTIAGIGQDVPVFRKTDQVWGVGHCSFVKSLCQTEDWIIYHSKSSRRPGWEDRDVHAKRFGWTGDGFPDFGAHLPRSRPTQPDLTSARSGALRVTA